jgi:putative transposase
MSLEGAVQEPPPHLGEVFGKLAEQRESRIEQDHLQADHVHMMISIPPKYAVSQVAGFIKGKSAIHLARVYGERKQNYAGQSFWACGYSVAMVGRDGVTIRDYILNQETENQRLDQLNMRESPATGMVARINQGRVSDPAQAALSRSLPGWWPSTGNRSTGSEPWRIERKAYTW